MEKLATERTLSVHGLPPVGAKIDIWEKDEPQYPGEPLGTWIVTSIEAAGALGWWARQHGGSSQPIYFASHLHRWETMA